MVQDRTKEEELSAGENDFLAKVMEVLYTTAVRPFYTEFRYERAYLQDGFELPAEGEGQEQYEQEEETF